MRVVRTHVKLKCAASFMTVSFMNGAVCSHNNENNLLRVLVLSELAMQHSSMNVAVSTQPKLSHVNERLNRSATTC